MAAAAGLPEPRTDIAAMEYELRTLQPWEQNEDLDPFDNDPYYNVGDDGLEDFDDNDDVDDDDEVDD